MPHMYWVSAPTIVLLFNKKEALLFAYLQSSRITIRIRLFADLRANCMAATTKVRSACFVLATTSKLTWIDKALHHAGALSCRIHASISSTTLTIRRVNQGIFLIQCLFLLIVLLEDDVHNLIFWRSAAKSVGLGFVCWDSRDGCRYSHNDGNDWCKFHILSLRRCWCVYDFLLNFLDLWELCDNIQECVGTLFDEACKENIRYRLSIFKTECSNILCCFLTLYWRACQWCAWAVICFLFLSLVSRVA